MKSLTLILSLFALISCSKQKLSDRAGLKMQEFVENISSYAKSLKSGFIIIPQNGPELAFKELDYDNGFDNSYINAIDGIGIEELFYNGTYSPDEYRIKLVKKIASRKTILVSEYIKNNNDVVDAYKKDSSLGFLCFIRTNDNYYYQNIPDTIFQENSNDILNLNQARNYLYLIDYENFQNKRSVIDSIKETNFDLIVMDLFFNNTAFTPQEITELKTKANGGKRLVISYINIGAAEKYRYYWQDDWRLHHPRWLKNPYEGYDDEIWVKFWEKDWQDIIYGNNDSYIKKIIDAGFDGAYLDNVEAYYFLYFD
jgi:cysteinyl-tRNA synthetase